MRSITKYLLLFMLFQPVFLHAQDISGTWEGRMDDEFLRVCIEQKDGVLCGYTRDYLFVNPESRCRAEFSGKYDNKKKEGMITGTTFIENSGSHTLMRIRFWMEPETGDTLFIKVAPKGFMSVFPGMAIETFLVRTSSKTDIKKWMRPCFPKVEPPPPVKPRKDTIRPSIPPPEIIPRRDTQRLPVTQSPVVPHDSVALARSMNVRKQTEQSRLVINTDHINLKLYDNGVVDNDTISVFYNGRLLVSHQRLSEKAVELNIDLDKNTTIHEITLYAENLGGIPPNTALIVVTAGGKRYELRSKANLEENAVLIFETTN